MDLRPIPTAHHRPPTVDRTPICDAPFVAMEFDAFGDVQVCCANALYPIGNVGEQSLREIWSGPRAAAMRAALSEGDMSLGCSVCRYRLTYGHGDLARDYYNNFPVSGGDPDWPFSLQFSLHNTCNLACVMCGADRSSRIRTQRSSLPPLPHAYGETFFEQIQPFLEHAGAVDFSGGEPFLVREHHRIWDLLIELDDRPLCSLTTNGTIWNERVEHVLDHLDNHISVSIDGMTPETLESIRVGASFDTVMRNIDRFLTYTRERGTILTMSWSLMATNWWELGMAARFAEERGIQLKVQTVIEPEFGVQRLPTAELRVVVETMEAESTHLVDELDLNRDMWVREVGRLRQELELRSGSGPRARCMEPPDPGHPQHLADMMLTGRPVLRDADLEAAFSEARTDLERWCDGSPIERFVADERGRLVELDAPLLLAGAAPDGVVDLPDLFRTLETAHGGSLWIGEQFDEGDRLVQMIWMGRPMRDKVGLVIRMISVTTDDGVVTLAAINDRLAPPSDEVAAEVPVTLLDRPAASVDQPRNAR